jgi:hypothetical protein
MMYLQVREGRRTRDAHAGLAGPPGGDLVAVLGTGKSADEDGVEGVGAVPEADVEGECPASAEPSPNTTYVSLSE